MTAVLPNVATDTLLAYEKSPVVSHRDVNSHSTNADTASTKAVAGNMTLKQPDVVLAGQLLPHAEQFDIGVDRVRLHYELDVLRTDGPSMGPFRARRGDNLKLLLGNVQVNVHITIRSQGGKLGGLRVWATVEFNPSGYMQAAAELADAICPWAAVRRLCECVVLGIEGIAPAIVPAEDIPLAAVHLTRDFSVDNPVSWLTATLGTSPMWSRQQALYVGDQGDPESIVAGSKTTRLVLYSKTTRSLRWEYQVSTAKALGRLDLGTIRDLNPEALALATAHLWRRSRIGVVRKHPRIVDLLAPDGRGDAAVRELVGWVAARAEGVRLDDGLSQRQVRAYKRRAAAAGIQVSEKGVRVVADPWRLDIVAGTEVAAEITGN